MIHPHTTVKFISPEIGLGLVATKLIPAGTITWVMDDLDREFKPEQISKMKPLFQEILDIYCFRNSKGNFVLCWDLARFVNHSFKPSCMTTGYEFEIAIRDIHPGEELTDDYGFLNIHHPFRGMDEGTKRKIVYPDDLLNYYPVWDKQLSKVFPQIPKVDQPLKHLLPKGNWESVENVAQGKEQMKSILEVYHQPGK